MMHPKKKWGWKTYNKPKDNKQKLVATLDRWFSKYIRLRDADKNGVCRCITCRTPHYWKDMHAGHFVLRDRKPTRWDERNVHAQCPHCNSFRSGEQDEHGRAIDRLYGAGTAAYLQAIGRARGAKIDSLWLELKIEEYKRKVKKLLTL
jgi:hypothetical protein